MKLQIFVVGANFSGNLHFKRSFQNSGSIFQFFHGTLHFASQIILGTVHLTRVFFSCCFTNKNCILNIMKLKRITKLWKCDMCTAVQKYQKKREHFKERIAIKLTFYLTSSSFKYMLQIQMLISRHNTKISII